MSRAPGAAGPRGGHPRLPKKHGRAGVSDSATKSGVRCPWGPGPAVGRSRGECRISGDPRAEIPGLLNGKEATVTGRSGAKQDGDCENGPGKAQRRHPITCSISM